MNQVEPLVAERIFKFLRSQQRALRAQLRNAVSESEESVRIYGVTESALVRGRSEWCVRDHLRQLPAGWT